MGTSGEVPFLTLANMNDAGLQDVSPDGCVPLPKQLCFQWVLQTGKSVSFHTGLDAVEGEGYLVFAENVTLFSKALLSKTNPTIPCLHQAGLRSGLLFKRCKGFRQQTATAA